MAETRNRTRRTQDSGRSQSRTSTRKVPEKSRVRTSSSGRSQAARKAGTKAKASTKAGTRVKTGTKTKVNKSSLKTNTKNSGTKKSVRNEDIKVLKSDQNVVTKINLGDSYYNLIVGTIIMILIGMLTVYIANGEISDLVSQFVFGAAGIFFMISFASNLGSVIYKKLATLAWLGSVVLLLLLRTPLGRSANGATRWLYLFGVSIQVVEIVKVATIIMSAYLLNKHYKDTVAPAVYVFVWGAAAIQAGMTIIFSSDLSSALVILLIAYIMTFIVMRHVIWHLFTAAGGIATFFVLYIKPALDLYDTYTVAQIKEMHLNSQIPYRVERILGWLHADVFQQDLAYQTAQSVRAIGSSGFLGKGLGSTLGTENFFAIESDFILAQLTSSFGILGLIGVLALFLFLVFNIVYTAANSRDRLFESLICTGIATHFLCQNLINFCVATGVFPNTGIPFIFLSSGTTSLLINCWEVGMVLAINKNAAKRLHKKGMLS